MKECKVNDKMSLYDVLHTEDTWYTADPDASMELIDYQMCPIHYNLVMSKYRNDQSKHRLPGPGAKALEVLIKTSGVFRKAKQPGLPRELRVKIISLLEPDDIKMVIASAALLKSQITKMGVERCADWIDEFVYLQETYEYSSRS